MKVCAARKFPCSQSVRTSMGHTVLSPKLARHLMRCLRKSGLFGSARPLFALCERRGACCPGLQHGATPRCCTTPTRTRSHDHWCNLKEYPRSGPPCSYGSCRDPVDRLLVTIPTATIASHHFFAKPIVICRRVGGAVQPFRACSKNKRGLRVAVRRRVCKSRPNSQTALTEDKMNILIGLARQFHQTWSQRSNWTYTQGYRSDE